LGFDWHSSGCTTVLGGVLKQIINPEEHGLIIAGGKGKNSTKVKEHLLEKAKFLDYTDDDVNQLSETSRLVAKIDNAAIQDGFSLYHHLMIVSEKNWGIIQQGLDANIGKARRYHWISDNLESYLNDPHKNISSEIFKENVMNLVSRESEECRKVSLDLLSEGSKRVKNMILNLRLKSKNQTSLDDFLAPASRYKCCTLPHLKMPIPFTLKWETLDLAKNLGINDYTELLKLHGFGPGMIRALALISEFIWGSPPCWKDPAKYSFAFGGKDGIPYLVNLKRMERCAEILSEAIDAAHLQKNDKISALKRLQKFSVHSI